MFVKLIVLIFALGGTSVGVLSVRQSRLIASNEMTRSRMRSRGLDRRSMELRTQIASLVTPDRIRQMMDDQFETGMVDETQRRIDILDPVEVEDVQPNQVVAGDVVEQEYWTLDDGTRVYLMDAEE